MSNITIQKPRGTDAIASPFFAEIEKLFDGIKQRAFDLFEKRSREYGHELDDWLEAERQVLWTPPAELVEKTTQFEVRIAAPGFEPKDIEVAALPDAIIVRAEANHTEEKKAGDIRFSEFGERKLYGGWTSPGRSTSIA